MPRTTTPTTPTTTASATDGPTGAPTGAPGAHPAAAASIDVPGAHRAATTHTDVPAPTRLLAATSWEELVTSALLGTDRRPPAAASGTGPKDVAESGANGFSGGAGGVPGRAGPDRAAAALLNAAALHTVRRRAGLLPAPAAPRPDPAPADPRPPLPEAARSRLNRLLADRAAPSGSGGRRGTAPDLTELIPQWLATANLHGYRAPDAALPALLDAARARTDLRPHALAFAGPRGLWLAGLNPEWKFALRGASGRSLLPDVTDPEAVHQLWEEGLFAERVALLAAVRAHEAGAARVLLATTWAGERAEDRLMFVDSLRSGLSDADEDFLEQALADRSRNVRATAAELLSALPESALARRMAARALSCVSPGLTGTDPSVAVEAPHECDAAMQRDGVVALPPSGRGERSWWLGQLVEASPLAIWPERFGGRDAREIVALPVADGWSEELHAAWCRAAVRQRDPEWARALLGTPSTPPSNSPGTASLAERSKLLVVLPAAERAGWVAEFIAAHGLSEAFQLLGVCPTPWAEPLGRSVVDALEIARDAGSYPWSFSGVMGLAERCLNPAEAGHLEVLTTTPDEPADASPGANGYWSEAFQRLVSTLRLRAEMDAELAPDR